MTGLKLASPRVLAVERPRLITFSGIDGSGKTTQIDNLVASLEAGGIRVRLLTFWNDMAVLGSVRETMSHTLFKSEKGIGLPGKPVERRDKNVRSWYMTIFRLCLYLLDAIRVRFQVKGLSRPERGVDVIVCDRYLYDELANLNLQNPVERRYAALLARVVPRPDVAFLLDADPVHARSRKPEYPLRFLRLNRAAYLDLADMTEHLCVVPPLPIPQMTMYVMNKVDQAIHRRSSADRTLSHSGYATATNR
jgi:thymidylate kinase